MRDACAAHGDCVDLAPEVFELDDVARVIGTGPDELLLAAAEGCPSAAIRIIDQRTRRAGLPLDGRGPPWRAAPDPSRITLVAKKSAARLHVP